MKKSHSNKLFEQLESIRNEIEGVEFWSARDLQKVFGYAKWQNFEITLKKAATSIENTSEELQNHFTEASKKVEVGSGATRELKDYALTRYACYLVAQNGDPNKEEIAFAQSYFAVQTRKQELIEKRYLEGERVTARVKLTETEKVLSELINQRKANFGYIRAMGDKALFGGLTTNQMKEKLGITNGALSDYLQTPLIKGKDFAASLTNENIRNKELDTTNQIANEHSANNEGVRKLMMERGIVPEQLSAGEDVKKIKRRLASEQNKLTKK